MEFMYCIPDLEVFIDKTIKKCLLEYDLDANDTEAVLDDMEKAWPKTPPRPAEKQVLKDCNDNTDKRRRCGHRSGTSQIEEPVQTFDKDVLKNCNIVLPEKSRELVERLPSNDDHPKEVLSNRKVETGGGEYNRSNTHSPDFGDGKTHSQKHAKLKSRLQQRYFGGHQTKNAIYETVEKSQELSKLVSSNLDLLASAANIHTESNRVTEEQRIQTIRRVHEDSGRYLQDIDSRPCLAGTADGAEPVREMPVLTRLMSSPSTPTRSHPLQYNNSSSSGPYINSIRTSRKESCTKSTPGTPTNEGQVINSARQKEDSVTSLVNTNKAKRLLQHYQNGYHTLIPPETVVVRRQLSSSNEKDLAAWNRQTPTINTHPCLQRNALATPSETIASYHSLSTHPRFLQHNQHHHMISHNFPEPLQHHVSRSRICSIIAEELQKDNSYHDISSRQTAPSAERIIPAGINCSAAQELKSDTSLVSDRAMSGEPPHNVPQTSQAQAQFLAIAADSVVRTSSRMPQVLPAHQVKPTHNSGSPILAFHLGHATTTCSNINKDNAVLANNIRVNDEDKPQDLSMGSRRIVEGGFEHSNYSCTSLSLNVPVTESERREYFSNPNSPMPTFIYGHHNETLNLRKSSSPSNNSDRECDYSSGNNKRYKPHKMCGKWEKIGQVHSLDLCLLGDYRTFVEKRRVETLQMFSDDAKSKTNKKRKID